MARATGLEPAASGVTGRANSLKRLAQEHFSEAERAARTVKVSRRRLPPHLMPARSRSVRITSVTCPGQHFACPWLPVPSTGAPPAAHHPSQFICCVCIHGCRRLPARRRQPKKNGRKGCNPSGQEIKKHDERYTYLVPSARS